MFRSWRVCENIVDQLETEKVESAFILVFDIHRAAGESLLARFSEHLCKKDRKRSA